MADAEIRLFREVAYSHFKAAKEFVLEAERILLKLVESNNRSHFLPDGSLKKFAFEKWFHLCYNTTSLGGWVYNKFRKSPLSQLGTIPVMHKLKFAVKGKFGLL
jgi:hypothetical protein